MTTAEYRHALDAALREYDIMTQQSANHDVRIENLSKTNGTLTRLCGLSPTIELGLTDAVRMALRAAGHPLTAVEVRAQLDGMGVDLDRYTNALAAIHTILKRLSESGEARFIARAWGKPAYVVRNSSSASRRPDPGAGGRAARHGPARDRRTK